MRATTYTGPPEKNLYVVAKNSSCSCLTVLPGPAWLLLNKICIPLFRAVYLSRTFRFHLDMNLLGRHNRPWMHLHMKFNLN